MNTKQQQEQHILNATVAALVEAGYWLSVNSHADQLEIEHSRSKDDIVRATHQTDRDYLLVEDEQDEVVGWVLLVYGNEPYELIADYTTNLEDELRPVNSAIDQMMAEA